jgi:FkbM family methyltransferase
VNIIRFLAFRLKTIRGMTVVHIGAHSGEEAERYQRWCARRVVWFEAAPYIFEKLQAHIKEIRKQKRSLFAWLTGAPRTEHILVQALVGEADGKTAEFHLFDNDGASNSIFRMARDENDRFPGVRETGEVLALPVQTLDRELENAGVSPESVDVLVLDVQGAELLCLKGAPRVLKTARYIETEVSREPVYEGGVLLSELESWLSKRNYVRKTSVRRSHMNAIFVRSD